MNADLIATTQEPTINADLIAAYTDLTARTGFGLKSARQLFEGGAKWPLINRLTDAGLMRIERWDGDSPVYRLFFL